MIGTKGQYLFSMQIAGLKSIISDADLILFKLIEEAGNKLPLFELIFQLSRHDLYQVFNQGNLLQVSFGVNQLEVQNLSLIIVEKDRVAVDSATSFVRLTGTIAALPYAIANTMYSKIATSKAVITELAGRFFKVESTVPEGKDSQSWLSNSKPVRSFINKVWAHSDVGGDVPLIGITSTGVFRHLSLIELAKVGPKYVLTSGSPQPGEVPLTEHPIIESNQAASNYLTGYSRSSLVNTLGHSQVARISAQPRAIVANTEVLDSIPTGTRLSSMAYHNENVHEKYHACRAQNIKSLIDLDSIHAKCYIKGIFVPFQVLDLVTLKDKSYQSKQSVTDSSGTWLVKKVAHIIQDKMFHTVLTLTRDSANSLLKGK